MIKLDRETRRHLAEEAEDILERETEAIDRIERVIIRLGYGESAPRFIQSPSTEHSVILTKRIIVYGPYEGLTRFWAQLGRSTVLPFRSIAWVVDSLIYGFTRNEKYGSVPSPRILWDLAKYPGIQYSVREHKAEGSTKTRKGGHRHDW